MHTEEKVFFPRERDFLLFCLFFVGSIGLSYLSFRIIGIKEGFFIPNMVLISLINLIVFLKISLEVRKIQNREDFEQCLIGNGLLSSAGLFGIILYQTYLILTIPLKSDIYVLIIISIVGFWMLTTILAFLASIDLNLKRIKNFENGE